MSKNKSGVYPVEYKILVKPDVVEEKTEGGIYIPDEARQLEQNGTIEGDLVSVGGLAFDRHTKKPWPEWREELLGVGARVVYSKFAGKVIEGDDGEEYRLMNDRDIIAIRSKR